MNLYRGVRWIAAAVVVFAMQACSDANQEGALFTPQNDGGTLAVVLSAPASQDGSEVGAVSFDLSGYEVTNLRAAVDGVEVFTRPDGSGWQVAVVGAGLDGALVRFDVADRAAALSGVEARLVEVANNQNESVTDRSGYGLRVTGVD
ncbi:MAG: hypothetical protein ACE5GJ_08970 [Gemmatimonadota bacterium]